MKNILKTLKIVALVAFSISFFSCDDTNVIEKKQTAAEYLEANSSKYSVLIAALKKANLYNTFRNPGSYTLFAPNNDAFASIGVTEATINALTSTNDITNLTRTLQYHLLGVGTVSSDLDFTNYFSTFRPYFLGTSTTATGNYSLVVANDNGTFKINGGNAGIGANVLAADIFASNGIIHEIDRVLVTLPKVHELAVANPKLSSLVGVLTSAPQATLLANITGAAGTSTATSRTIFAPTNDAFTAAASFLQGKTDAQITQLLQYHIENNYRRAGTTNFSSTANITVTTQFTGQTFVITQNTLRLVDTTPSNANIRITNVQGTNGVIHVIDKVLRPTL
jgi:uncharacterized surface protein with fasciclin (FAS1) repeats